MKIYQKNNGWFDLEQTIFPLIELDTNLRLLDLTKYHSTGNKQFKLQFNLEAARKEGCGTLLSFGGAWSNHLLALAKAAREQGFTAVGIVRGEKPLRASPVLAELNRMGMRLEHVTRDLYRRLTFNTGPLAGEWQDEECAHFMARLEATYGHYFLLPEGGSNGLAVAGCRQIANLIEKEAWSCDLVCLPVGTGGTLAGLVAGLAGRVSVLGFSALKGLTDLESRVRSLLEAAGESNPGDWSINHDYHFGGFAKSRPELRAYIERFEANHGLRLDPVYNSKMLYGIQALRSRGAISPSTRVLAIHTGGYAGS